MAAPEGSAAPKDIEPDSAPDPTGLSGPPRSPARRWRAATLKALRWVLVGVFGVAALGSLSLTSPTVRWRAKLLYHRARGEFREIPFPTFVRWLGRDSVVDLSPLLDNRNVGAAISNELTDDAAANVGMRIFADNCARCHGEQGLGAVGPSLVSSIGRFSDWSYFSTVKWGRRGTLMLPQPLSDREIWSTLTFVRRLLRSSEASRLAKGEHPRLDVRPEQIARASETSDEWLTYAGGYAGHHHSRLAQITPKNVRQLTLAWSAQFRTTEESLQGSPLVSGDLLFVPGPPGELEAFDARTGVRLWQFARPVPSNIALCCGTGNRGMALVGDTIFAATLDAHLVAVEAHTGRHLWETEVADVTDGYSMTGAPLVIGDRVVVGVAGGDYGAPGFLAAFSTRDGRRLWQFDTVPKPGQPGHETWTGDSWKTGGASTWMTGAYDPGLGLVYWGVANAAPVYANQPRHGDNLYSMCALALDLATGKLRWHYQFTPADEHDWDSANQPIVADITWKGSPTAALLWANRNGFFYGLDRRTGQFLFAKPFAKQTWATGFDPAGRPITDPRARPSAGGTLVWPWAGGATNWQPPSYDAARGLVFIPTTDAAGLFYSETDESREPGQIVRGGAARRADDQPGRVSLKAVAAASGDVRWDAELAQGLDVGLYVSGVLSTDGGLVFVGHAQEFLAFDADTGKQLWRINLGGLIKAAPISYAVDGKQMIAIMAGRSLYVLALPDPAR
jgi:alcohol dehydrogenase (cytochrome c)